MKKIVISFLILIVYALLDVSYIFSQTRYDTPIRAYIGGVEVLSYKTENLELSLAPRLSSKSYGFGKEIRLYVVLRNQGESPLDFNPKTIKAFTVKKGKEVELKVYSSSEYLKKLKKNILWFGPDNVESVNTSTSIKGGEGQMIGNVESNTNVYTGGRDAAYSDAEEYVRKEYLKRNTVFAGQELSGIIAIDSPKGKSFVVHIELNDSHYIFKFEPLN